MTRRTITTLLGAITAVLLLAAPASAELSITNFELSYTNTDPSSVTQDATQAGSHPDAVTTDISFSTRFDPVAKKEVGDGSPKDITVELPAGFIGNTTAVPECSTAEFLTKAFVEGNEFPVPDCPDSSAVGVLTVLAPGAVDDEDINVTDEVAAFNLVPPPGAAAKIGFLFLNVPIALLFHVDPQDPHNLIASLRNTSDIEPVGRTILEVWGTPADASHDKRRGHCAGNKLPISCPAGITKKAFLTLPRACTGPLPSTFAITSWETPQLALTGSSTPLITTGCGKLPFGPTITAKPTTLAAQSPTGLDFSLDVDDEGLGNPEGLAHSDIEKAVVSLPEGFSVNPSIADGLEVCTQDQLARERAGSYPGEGCPNAAKIGTVEVETPLLDESVNGALYQAAPYENPFGSLIALYMVIRNPQLGIVITQPIRVDPDPATGRLTTTASDLPQLPFSHFRLRFREGARSPLASPPGCGTYKAEATLYPWSKGTPVKTDSAFEIITGPEAGPCPSGGLPPFRPGLIAGTTNNAAGHFSPFNLRMFRSDSEQEITHFSIKLPPGLVGKLAGVAYCPEAQIAAAKARTGPHGGAEEIASPSCPPASEIGRTLVGSGVGSSLAYAPGKLYLAGPYNGSALSLVAITAGVVGPFDIGTVLVRQAFRIDPETAEVFIDATGSDPIPHIIKGIPVHLRDIRAYVDRPDFVLNPTSCTPTSTASTVLGSGLDFASAADDNPVVVSTRFQAADCAALPFKPKLSLKLGGSTRRAGNPALHAHLAMGGFGESGLAYAQVALPKSQFLDNSHIGTLCTRVQFRSGATPGEGCPARSIYGSAKASTPILDAPLEGPVFLRSNPERELPDLVAALHNGQINIVAVGNTDSAPGGGLRNTFAFVPDAPISTVDIDLFGGKRGLLESSANLCRGRQRATVRFKGHNGKALDTKVRLKAAGCGKGGKGKKAKRGTGGGR